MKEEMIRLTREVEGYLTRELDLWPIPLGADMARATGHWKGDGVTIETRAYAGSVVRYARFAVVSGQKMGIGNILCVPSPEHPLPILGADLVSIREGSAMAAADLSPTLPPGPARERQLMALIARRSSAPPLPPGGQLPPWCTDWFSPYPLFTRGTKKELLGLDRALQDYATTFVELALASIASREKEEAVLAMQRGYLDAHRTEDKGLNLLAKMFGQRWADRYLDTVLFPPPGIMTATPVPTDREPARYQP